MCEFRSKLVCFSLSKTVKVTDSKNTSLHYNLSILRMLQICSFIVQAPGAFIINLITTVIYGFP